MAKAERIPSWADMKAIRAVYVQAAALGLTVDHIIPLRGKTVSGLHVENNLRIITGRENDIKSNKFIEELL